MAALRKRGVARRDGSSLVSRVAARTAFEVLEGRRLFSGSLNDSDYTVFTDGTDSSATNVVASYKQADGGTLVVGSTVAGGVLIKLDAHGSVADVAHIPSPSGPITLSDSTLAGNQLIVVGQDAGGATVVMRYSGLTLDTNFGDEGVATINQDTPELAGGFSARSVTVDGSGVLVAGQTSYGVDGSTEIITNAVSLVKFDSTGALDTHFDVDGVAVNAMGAISSGAQYADPAEVIVTLAGQIVVVGSASSSEGAGGNGVLVARYNADGSLDTNFGDADVGDSHVGWTSYSDNVFGSAHGIGVRETLIGGESALLVGAELDAQFAVVSFTNNSVGGDGHFIGASATNLDTNVDTAFFNGFASDGLGNVYLGGTVARGTESELAVAKFDSQGHLITAFGDNGLARFEIPGTEGQTVTSVNGSSDGTLLLSGTTGERGKFIISSVIHPVVTDPTPVPVPTNHPPVVSDITASAVVSQFDAQFSAVVSDADSADTITVSGTVDGATVPVTRDGDGTVHLTYAFTDKLTHIVALSASDGTVTKSKSLEVTPVSAGVVDGNLLVAGGSGNDTIRVTKSGGSVSLSVGGAAATVFASTGKIVVKAGAGNDVVVIGATVPNDADLDGGAGDDLLFGGAGKDTVTGGAGKDLLDGGRGFLDVLSGGDGNDFLRDGDGVAAATGGAGNDVIDLTFAAGWKSAAGTRVSNKAIAGNGGSDVIAITTAASALGAITFNIDADSTAADLSDGGDTVLLFGNYANGSLVNLDGLGVKPSGYVDLVDRLYAEHNGVGTGGVVPAKIASKLQAQLTLTLTEVQFLAGFVSANQA